MTFFFIKGLFTIRFWNEYIYKHRKHSLIHLFNKTVRRQEKDPLSIPVVIINFNRLTDLRILVDFLIKRKHTNIVIVDNQSAYPPLLDYYESIKDIVTIEYMDKNYGHMVFWENEALFGKYSSGYCIVTDSDIIPNEKLPSDYVSVLMNILNKNKDIVKVGFALKIDDIPDYYKQKQNVLNWEKQYWEKPIAPNIYSADIDTTFALYPPRYRYNYMKKKFIHGIRLAGEFTARHTGWYIDNDNLSEEEKFYFKTANSSNSWKLAEQGNFSGSDIYT
jgi:hypothetical protein